VWLSWLLAIVGVIIAGVGLGVAASSLVTGDALEAARAGGIATVTGLGLLSLGLAVAAVRALRMRRLLSDDRYRGPSVVLLFFLALAFGNFLTILALVVGGSGLTDLSDPAVLIGLLLVTPVAFGLVTGACVLAPKALPGWDLIGDKPALRLLQGVAIGLAAWIAATALEVALSALYEAVTGSPPEGGQVVVDLADTLPAAVAFLLVAGVVPAVEELFFRGVAVTAWVRERGPRFALIASTLLFTVAHLGSTNLLAIPAIGALGLLLGAVFLRWRSLPLNFGLHGAFNAVSVALLVTGVIGT
jgi:membrane protease YdiL (CAAX protease family)